MEFKTKNWWIIRIFILFLMLFALNSLLLYVTVKYLIEILYLSSIWYFAIFNILFLILALYFNNKKETIKIPSLNRHFLGLFLLFFVLYLSEFFYSSFQVYKQKPFNFDTYYLIFMVVALTIVPVFEELFFRKIFLDPFIIKGKVILGLFITSIFFSIAHFPLLNHFSLLKAFDLFIFGFILGLIRLFFGLKYAIIGHAFRDLLSILYNYHIVNLFVIEYIGNRNIFKLFYYLNFLVVMGILLVFIYKIRRKFQ